MDSLDTRVAESNFGANSRRSKIAYCGSVQFQVGVIAFLVPCYPLDSGNALCTHMALPCRRVGEGERSSKSSRGEGGLVPNLTYLSHIYINTDLAIRISHYWRLVWSLYSGMSAVTKFPASGSIRPEILAGAVLKCDQTHSRDPCR